MKSIMNTFKVNKDVTSGNCIYNITCPNCNKENTISIYNKLNKQKIRVVKCYNCKQYIEVGEIFNFESGSRLHQRLDNRFNSDNYDKFNWL